MATLTVQEITRAGTTVTLAAATGGGDKFAPGSATCLRVANGGGGAITVTVVTPNTLADSITIGDVSVSVGAGVTRDIGPFPYEFFANPTDGLADITYSGVTSVTVGAWRLKQP